MGNYDIWKIGRAIYRWRRRGARFGDLEFIAMFFVAILSPMLILLRFLAPKFLLGLKKRMHKKKMQEIKERKIEHQEMVDRINRELDEEFGIGGEA